ncbi:MAG: SAM-dependent methyltransferase, partial [Dehalococcoidia bacterium]|nr:SAM-dependent methyltransferase [Dehalococcoidia bacterium]
MKKLEDLIKEKILSEGPITFHDFMEMALYYLELGYYRQGKEQIGEFGDFYTSPVTHPIFGALLAIQIEQMWQILGRPPDFTVVEMGSGKGLLASDILSYLPLVSPELAGNIIYLAIEHGNAGRICSSSLMQSTGSNSSRDKLSGEPENIIGCFLSNEFFDALPTHRVIVQNGELKEIYVGLDRGNFVEITCNLSTNQVYQRLKDENVILEEGQYGEINLQVPYWVDWMGQRLSRGFVLSIDYGYTAKELYSTSRYQGTVMTYYRHIEGRNPYIRVGEQDISSHVDFTAVLEAGEKKGLQALSLVTQKEFLQNLGIRSF